MNNSIYELLRENSYPGRGIILGCSEDRLRSILVYFIMGRSVNSRNRVFERTDDGIKTAAFDLSELSDPSLVIYHPLRRFNGFTIVTNGDQTDTIRGYLQQGLDFQSALKTREFEPDRPNYTPRISGLMHSDGSYELSILKSSGGDPSCCVRSFFEYSAALPGLGHFITTYSSDGNPLPSFEGEPIVVQIDVSHGIVSLAESIWQALDSDNKVSVYACETRFSTGEYLDHIINKNGNGHENDRI